MTRTVEDTAKVFQVIAGADPDDAATAAARNHPKQDYLASLERTGLRGARLGILREAYERETTDPEIVRLFTAAVEDLRTAGATIIDVRKVTELEGIKRTPDAGVCMGFKYTINRYLGARGDRVPVKTLAEILKSGGFHPSNQRRLELAEQDAEDGPDSLACQAEKAYRDKVRQALSSMIDRLKVDALIYPTWSNPPRLIGDLNTPHGNNSPFYSPTTGFPAISVPMGFTRGGILPAGMTILGRAWSEVSLLRFAYAYEQLTHHRRPPPTTPPLR
jgi:Asp-tRNA(Asn)/Glu-tRNA(Gln) amidotransferase A subunit family amidase